MASNVTISTSSYLHKKMKIEGISIKL